MTAAGIRFSPAHADDTERLAELHVAIWLETYPGLVPQAVIDRISLADRTAKWRQWMADGVGSRTIVARLADGTAIGFAMTGRADSTRGFAAAELFSLYLLAAHHGRGIGHDLFVRACALARVQGAPDLGLWVVEGNQKARRFYERHGAVRVEARVANGISEVGYRLALGPSA